MLTDLISLAAKFKTIFLIGQQMPGISGWRIWKKRLAVRWRSSQLLAELKKRPAPVKQEYIYLLENIIHEGKGIPLSQIHKKNNYQTV